MNGTQVRSGSTPLNLLASSLVPPASEVSFLARFCFLAPAIPRGPVQDSLIISTIPIPKIRSRNFEWQWRILTVSVETTNQVHLNLTSPSRCDTRVLHPRGKGRVQRASRSERHVNRSGTVGYRGRNEEHNAEFPSTSLQQDQHPSAIQVRLFAVSCRSIRALSLGLASRQILTRVSSPSSTKQQGRRKNATSTRTDGRAMVLSLLYILIPGCVNSPVREHTRC